MTDSPPRQERRVRDRAAGIQLRRRESQAVEVDQRRRRDGFDIAAALELHLDEVTTRRAMIALLESWLNEAVKSAPTERDEGYEQAVGHAIEVMRAAPDVPTAIAVLQRQS